MLQAEILKTLASPRRLEILHALARGPMGVGRIARQIGASQPNVSQHLAVMRGAGLVDAQRDGREVRVRLIREEAPVVGTPGVQEVREVDVVDATGAVEVDL